MWIERVTLENFLPFSAVDVELAPGLNVILSPNEGGKSSLFRGIVTALFTDASSRSGEVRALGRWGSGELFKVELDLWLGDEPFHLVRDFRSKEQKIHRAGETAPLATGRAVDAFLRDFLPLTEESLFLRVCGVRHEELARVSDGAGIGERIEEILGGGWGEMTPARFKHLVETKRRELLTGRDRPAYDENTGLVRRFMNGVEQAERELAKAREAGGRREDLLRRISALDSSLERLEAEIGVLRSRRDQAARYGEVERAEGDLLARAEDLRKRIERLKALGSKKKELLGEGARFPEQLRSAGGEGIEALRRALELEAVLVEEAERGRGGARPGLAGGPRGTKLAGFVAALVFIIGGIIGGVLWKREILALIVLGIGFLLWCIRRPRGVRAIAPAAERARELEELARKRHAWAGEQSISDSQDLVRRFVSWVGELRETDSRLDELDAGRAVDPDAVLRRLDDEYGRIALKARALAEERARLEPFKADAEECLKLERLIRSTEGDREKTAAERAQKEKELAAIEYRDASEIGERLEAARESLRRVERKVEVMDVLLEALDAARRDMSGFLAERLPPLAAGYLSRITEGRYEALFIDPLTMAIEIGPAAGGRDGGGTAGAPARINPAVLSQGTRDQIHFAVRLALIELLSRGEAQPLFLDDPFVHFDPARRERAVELVSDFSRAHQVILFTCDPFYRERGQRLVELAR